MQSTGQTSNAHRVRELGAGAVLTTAATPETIRRAAADALASDALRGGARRLAAVTAAYGGGTAAVTTLERIAAGSHGT